MQQDATFEKTCDCDKKSCSDCNKYKNALKRNAKKHVPTGYFTKIKSDHPELLDELDNVTEHNYTGKNGIKDMAVWFLTKHIEVFKKCDFNKKKIMTSEDGKDYNKADKCHICNEEFMDTRQNKVIRELLFDEKKINRIL